MKKTKRLLFQAGKRYPLMSTTCLVMAEIQRFINEHVDGQFRFRKFQLDDLARGALTTALKIYEKK